MRLAQREKLEEGGVAYRDMAAFEQGLTWVGPGCPRSGLFFKVYLDLVVLTGCQFLDTWKPGRNLE